MPVGIGGLIASLTQGDPTAQIANALAGPNPNPQAQTGGAPSPTGAQGQAPGAPGVNPPPPQQQMPPAPGYAPDPANAKTIDLLLRVNQREALAQDLNRGLQQVASGFGTQQQQHDSMEALRGMPQGGGETLGALGQISQLQQAQFKLQNEQQFQAGAEVLGQNLGMNWKPGVATALAQSGQLPQIIATHLSAMEPPEQVKVYRATIEEMRRQGMPEDQIQRLMPPESMMLGANADIGQRQYEQEKAQAAREGRTDFPNYPTWQANNQEASKNRLEEQHNTEIAQHALPQLNDQLNGMKTKIDAVTSQPDVIKGITEGGYVKQNAANAVFHWDGKGADPSAAALANGSLTQPEIDFINNARWLHLQNYQSNFKSAGSGQRLSQGEAQRLGDAADSLGNFSVSADQYTKNANTVSNRIEHAKAASYGDAHAFEQMPVETRAKLDKSFLPGGVNAIPNPPKWMVPVEVSSPQEAQALPKGQAYKIKSGSHAGEVHWAGLEGQED